MMLIREAYALSESAHTLLETLYERGVEGDLAPYDRRIFAYVKATAEEGLPRPRLTLARMYVRGLGVPQDLPKAISLLKDVSGESAMELMKEISGMQRISPQAAPKTTSIR
jgi:TPR repeat protein